MQRKKEQGKDGLYNIRLTESLDDTSEEFKLSDYLYFRTSYRLRDLCLLSLSREELLFTKESWCMDAKISKIRDALILMGDEDEFGSYRLSKFQIALKNEKETRVGAGDTLEDALDNLTLKMDMLKKHVYSGSALFLVANCTSASDHLSEIEPKLANVSFSLETDYVRVNGEHDLVSAIKEAERKLLIGLKAYHTLLIRVLLSLVFISKHIPPTVLPFFSGYYVMKKDENGPYMITRVLNPYLSFLHISLFFPFEHFII